MKTRQRLAIALALSMPVSMFANGCKLFSDSNSDLKGTDRELGSLFQNRNERELTETTKTKQTSKIANPPARTIRFDGHEIVLGNGESASLAPDKLLSQLRLLVEKRKLRSATILAQQHPEVSERLLAERWTSNAGDPVLKLVASAMSQHSISKDTDWNSLLRASTQHAEEAKAYQKHRTNFTAALQTTDPTDEVSSQLQQSAQQFSHPLVTIDCLRLLGLREQLADRAAWAESLYRQAAKVAEESGNMVQAADLGLMIAEAMQRRDALQESASVWSTAVRRHLTTMTSDDAMVDSSFWVRADKIRPGKTSFPDEIVNVMGPFLNRVGCSNEGETEMVLWTAVSQAQFDRGEFQLALLNLKKAETSATGNDSMWLRIAQSKCLSALGQIPAAAAILSGPAASKEPRIAAAAMAGLGSAKLQTGAYQQGAQLLNRALSETSGLSWATKSHAQADLALARLIIGDTDQGLDALHLAQDEFEQEADFVSLVQSLDNELRLLEHERRTSESQTVKNRIAQLERL